jgi:hypothetical protein
MDPFYAFIFFSRQLPPLPLAPSGASTLVPDIGSRRFLSLLDIGPGDGCNILPYLVRGVEGRSLAACAPRTSHTSTLVRHPKQEPWPREIMGVLTHTVGSQGWGDAHFGPTGPSALTLSPRDQFLLAADASNRRVCVFTAHDGEWVTQLTGPPGMHFIISVI